MLLLLSCALGSGLGCGKYLKQPQVRRRYGFSLAEERDAGRVNVDLYAIVSQEDGHRHRNDQHYARHGHPMGHRYGNADDQHHARHGHPMGHHYGKEDGL